MEFVSSGRSARNVKVYVCRVQKTKKLLRIAQMTFFFNLNHLLEPFSMQYSV
jgi:hypothetical protein